MILKCSVAFNLRRYFLSEMFFLKKKTKRCFKVAAEFSNCSLASKFEALLLKIIFKCSVAS
jgi:hypothetical protein